MADTAKNSDPRPQSSGGAFALGLVLLLVAIGASVMLVLPAFGTSLPGCGPQSGCDRAAASVWGSVPGLGWPTSHVGLAFFLGLLAAWIVTRGALDGALRWLVRIGVVVSVVLIGAMIFGGYLCQYCLAAHVANIAFAVLVERTARRASAPAAGPLPWAALAGLFIVATGGLVVAQSAHDAKVAAQDEADLESSIAAMTGGGAATTDPAPTDPAVVEAPAEPFTGRFREGPEAAAIRLVIISDYQCPDCKRIEGEVEALVASMPNLSYSHKHFPMNSLCNDFCAERNFNPHPNACWAARAAEAAGILQGDEGFFKVHNWLFSQSGSFTDQSLPPALRELGFDPQQFIRVMSSQQTLDNVRADIDEAIALGLHYTPMVFINGVELKGWRTRNALTRAVNAVAATNPPALTAAADRPPMALGKYIDDWKAEAQRVIPPDAFDWSLGPAAAPAQIVVWGDYEEPGTASLDERLRAAIAGRNDVRYSFRHYPVDQSCNALASRTLHEQACRMAQAAEAAGRLGGRDAYWAMHAWLLANQATFTDTGLRGQAGRLGLDFDALVREMGSDEVAAAITDDAGAAKQLGINPIPFFWINGRRVPRWNLEGEDVIARLIDEAAAE